MNYWTQSTDNIYVAAHRGWSEDYPENTMIAFEKAMEIGCDQIETDVRVTKDGRLVLIHDHLVDRTTDGTGKVCDYTLEELQKLDAGSWKGEEFAGTRIPEFTDLMELVKDHPTMTLDVELKEYPEEGREELAYSVCDRVLKILDDYGFTDRCVINSWSGKLNEYVYRTYGERFRQHVYYPQKYLGECTIDPYSYGYCCCMFDEFGIPEKLGMASKEEFDGMRVQGVQPWAGASVKDAASVDLAIHNGADLITCNNPDKVLALLKERGKHR